jgi:large subunit ribosomal protein L4
MPGIAVYNIEGKQTGEIQLNDAVFSAEINESVMHEVVVMQLANRRKGTASTKTRGEVRGGGRKPWRQKGTGRARVGSIRSPLWKGGAITFGPKPRDYSYSVPKKIRRKAVTSALSSKYKEEEMIVLDALKIEQPKTKEMAKVLKNLSVDQKALIVLAEKDENVVRSSNNIPGVTLIAAESLNVYDILNNDKLIMTKDAVARVEEVLA